MDGELGQVSESMKRRNGLSISPNKSLPGTLLNLKPRTSSFAVKRLSASKCLASADCYIYVATAAFRGQIHAG